MSIDQRKAKKPAILPAKARKPDARRKDSGKGTNCIAGKGRPSPVTPPAAQSKTASILALLSRNQGASVADLMEATGWLPHSVRAAITGLRKQDHAVTRSKDASGTTRYRIVQP